MLRLEILSGGRLDGMWWLICLREWRRGKKNQRWPTSFQHKALGGCWHTSWKGFRGRGPQDLLPSLSLYLVESQSWNRIIGKQKSCHFQWFGLGGKQCGIIWVHLHSGGRERSESISWTEWILKDELKITWKKFAKGRGVGEKHSALWEQPVLTSWGREKPGGPIQWTKRVQCVWNSGAGGKGHEKAGRVGTRSGEAVFQTLS